jgi:transposase
VIHADDTPVNVLAPGHGMTKTGRFWVYLRDERPHLGPAPPAAFYQYAPDRKAEHCRTHLASFTGHLHADGYCGYVAAKIMLCKRPVEAGDKRIWFVDAT